MLVTNQISIIRFVFFLEWYEVTVVKRFQTDIPKLIIKCEKRKLLVFTDFATLPPISIANNKVHSNDVYFEPNDTCLFRNNIVIK